MKKNISHKFKVNELSALLNEIFKKMAQLSIKQELGLCQWSFLHYAKCRMLVFTNSL
jgi:hypothetical protein